LIESAISGASSREASLGNETKTKVASVAPAASAQEQEVEKLAGVLEFIASRGVENLVKAAGAADPPPGTDENKNTKATHTQSQVAPHKGAPPMSGAKVGLVENTQSQRPGGGGNQPQLSGTGQTHHPALSSNAAAADIKKAVHAQNVGPDLQKLLNATPFADPKLKENLAHAAESGEKNIHSGKSKIASADQARLVKEALARKVAAAKAGGAA